MIDWTTIIVALISSSGLATIIVNVMNIRNNKKDKRNTLQIARDDIMVALAGNTQINIMERCLCNGYMTISERKYCDKLHKAYKALGGNDIVDSLWEQCLDLPIQNNNCVK